MLIVFFCAQSSIGAVYFAQGMHDDALTQWQEALKVRVKVFGLEHPEPAKTKVNIGNVYKSMGEYEKALSTYSEALPVLEAKLGCNHPETAGTKNKCAPFTFAKTPLFSIESYCLCVGAAWRSYMHSSAKMQMH